MEKELEEKIKKLSYFSMYVNNIDKDEPRRFSGVVEGVLEFKRDEILLICENLYSFVIYGLSRMGKSDDVVEFIDEYLSGRFQYKNGTSSTVRFIHFANRYMDKFKKGFSDTPFEIGNVFLREQTK